MNNWKKYTVSGKEFNEENKFTLYGFSKNDIDITKVKKNRYNDSIKQELIDEENQKINFETDKKNNVRLFFPNDDFFCNILQSPNINSPISETKYIYKVKIAERSIVKYWNNYIINSLVVPPTRHEKYIYVNGELNLLEKYELNDFLEEYENCKDILEDGLCISPNSINVLTKIPEKNKTKELLFLLIKGLKKIEKIEWERMFSTSYIFNLLQIFPKSLIDYEIFKELAEFKMNNGCIFFRNIPKKFICDELLKILIKNNSGCLTSIPEEYMTYDFCLYAVKMNKNIINELPDNYIGNNFILELVKEGVEIPTILRREKLDREIINQIIKIDGNYLKILHSLDIDKELVKNAVCSGLSVLKYVPLRLKDYQICKTAIESQKNSVLIDFDGLSEFIPKKIIDKKLCDKIAEKLINFLRFIPNQFKNHEICLKAINNFLETTSERYYFYTIFLNHPLTFMPNNLLKKGFLTNDLKLKIVRNFPYSLRLFPRNLISFEMCNEALAHTQDIIILNTIPEKFLFYNLEMCVKSITQFSNHYSPILKEVETC
jgi:hypothetical protein